jgi:hypothetical protein
MAGSRRYVTQYIPQHTSEFIQVAVKTFVGHMNLADKEVQNFALLAGHVNIISVLGVGDHYNGYAKEPCLVLEFAECGSLHELLHRECAAVSLCTISSYC